ncbi:hypothetical protein NDU88_006045 [Pleurodeles waltl]|uniref:Uncharacterized protein n=1 Tax=Pleurodeles waltl TaxID=8319 RepID=A0AAV7RKH4_PLEWA|nr:hypothetical protein NDU88_006045 [Pleurodeles waltl]
MEQYTTSTPLPQRQTRLGGLGEALEEPVTGGEPTRANLLAAMQGSTVALEGKIETVAVEVKLLQADLRKVKAKLRALNIRFMLLYTALLKVISGGKTQFFEHPAEVWRWLEIWDRVGPGPSGRSGIGSARTRVDGMDWMRNGEGPAQVSAQQCVDSDSCSRIEIHQDGTIAVVDPEQAVVLVGPLDMEDGVISDDS